MSIPGPWFIRREMRSLRTMYAISTTAQSNVPQSSFLGYHSADVALMLAAPLSN